MRGCSLEPGKAAGRDSENSILSILGSDEEKRQTTLQPLDWQTSGKWKYEQNTPVRESQVGAPHASSKIAKPNADKGGVNAGYHPEWRQRRFEKHWNRGYTNLCHGKHVACCAALGKVGVEKGHRNHLI